MKNKEIIRQLIENGEVDECTIDEVLDFINSDTKAKVAHMTRTLEQEASNKINIAKDQIAEAFDETIMESMQLLHSETETAINSVHETMTQVEDCRTQIQQLLDSPNLPLTTDDAIKSIHFEQANAIELIQVRYQECNRLHKEINEMKNDLDGPLDILTKKLHENSEKLYQFEQKVDTDYHHQIIKHADSRIEEMETNISLIKR